MNHGCPLTVPEDDRTRSKMSEYSVHINVIRYILIHCFLFYSRKIMDSALRVQGIWNLCFVRKAAFASRLLIWVGSCQRTITGTIVTAVIT